jgi:hypothetical protein
MHIFCINLYLNDHDRKFSSIRFGRTMSKKNDSIGNTLNSM